MLKRQRRHPITRERISRTWISKWYPRGGLNEVYGVPTGGKRKSSRKHKKKEKGTKTKRRRHKSKQNRSKKQKGSGASMSMASSEMGNLLLKAVHSRDDIETIEMLLQNGADVNAKDDNYGFTPLIKASMLGDTVVVSMLLEKGADVNAKNYRNQTSLWWASMRGFIDIVDMLLEKGADVNVKDLTNNSTALLNASSEGFTEIARMLLDNGADVNVTNYDGDTALTVAFWKGHEEIVLLLEKSIKDEQIIRDNKQKAMELVRNRVEKVPSLRTLAHRNIDTHATKLYNKAVMDGTVQPLGSKLGGKRKQRQRGGQPNEIQEGTRDYIRHRKMFLQRLEETERLKDTENDKPFQKNVNDAIKRYNIYIDEINRQLPDKGHTKKMPRLSNEQMINIYNDIETKIMTDFDLEPKEFEVNLDILESENTA